MTGYAARLRRLVACTAVATSLAGCASFAPYFLDRDAPKASELRSSLLLPFNFDLAPAPQFVQGTEILEEKMVRFLADSGLQVHRLALSATLEEWSLSLKEVGGIESGRPGQLDPERHEAARAALVRRVLALQAADAVVLPTVLAREAHYSGQKLHWDGVWRDAPIDMGGTTRALAYLDGSEFATSLRVSVYDRSGNKIFERYAGLEPIARYETKQDRWRRVLRTDLFEDDEILDSGVRMAFDPWIEASPVGAE